MFVLRLSVHNNSDNRRPARAYAICTVKISFIEISNLTMCCWTLKEGSRSVSSFCLSFSSTIHRTYFFCQPTLVSALN